MPNAEVEHHQCAAACSDSGGERDREARQTDIVSERARARERRASAPRMGGGMTITHKRVGRLGEKVRVEGVQAGGNGKLGWEENGGNEVTPCGVLIPINSFSLARWRIDPNQLFLSGD